MSQLGTILWAKNRIARHAIASIRNESRLKVGVVSFSAAALWAGAFIAFLEGFAWLRGFDPVRAEGVLSIGDIVMVRMLAVFALALFLMLIFSNVLIVYSTVYRSREVAYLLCAPVPVRTFFLARFAECVAFSSWASAYLGSPLILAYGLSTDAPWAFYPAAALFYVPYVVIPAALGAIAAIAFVTLFPRLPKGSLVILGGAAVAMLYVYLRHVLNSESLSDDNIVFFLDRNTRATQSGLLPSYWLTQGLLDVASADYRRAGFNFLLLCANALFFSLVASEAAARHFFSGYSALAGGQQRAVRRRSLLDLAERALGPLRNPARALVVKDVRLFWRDPTQWMQFVVFFGIMAVYTANLRNRAMGNYNEVYASWIACLNAGACTLILATLTSRFVYPLVSLEGCRFWVIGLAPVTIRQIVWQKFWLSVATTSPFSVGLILLSSVTLALEPVEFALSVYSVVLANFSLAGLAVGLGSLYPNMHEDNPARIVSGMGGTLNFLLSVGYIALSVLAQMAVFQWAYIARYVHGSIYGAVVWSAVVFVSLLSVTATLLPMHLGLRNLEEMEF